MWMVVIEQGEQLKQLLNAIDGTIDSNCGNFLVVQLVF
jgi:hypothetical protein